jgi:hypothetical protein
MASAGHERAGLLANIAGQQANWIGQMLPLKVTSTAVHAAYLPSQLLPMPN